MSLFHLFRKATALWLGKRGEIVWRRKARVAIARAMLKKAPITILDEATGSFDTISEKYIQDSFEQLMKGRTTIVIAHRLSTVQKNGQDYRVRKRQNIGRGKA